MSPSLAWDIIDGTILIMGGMLERSQKAQLIMRLRARVEPIIDAYLEPGEREPIYQAMARRVSGANAERIQPWRVGTF